MRASYAAAIRRRSSAMAWLGAALWLGGTIFLGMAEHAHAADAGIEMEQAIEATYLYKLPSFVTWEPGSFASPTSPFTVCIVGADPFGDLIDRAVVGQKIGEHTVAVSRLPRATHESPCHLMYIARGEQPVAEALQAVDGAATLTVTSAPDDSAKGIVNFVVRDNHVRFEIDLAAAKRNHLEISSKLLSVALSVTPK